MVTSKVAPRLCQLVDLLLQCAFSRREKHCVDRAGRDPSDDLKMQIGKMVRQTFEQSDLIGGACPAAGQHHSEVARFFASLSGNFNQFRYAHSGFAFQTFCQPWFCT